MSDRIYALRVVAAPERNAREYVDLADGKVVSALAEDFDLGTPDLLIDDDERVVQGGREITIKLELSGPRSDVEARLRALALSVAGEGRWLLVQRTERTPPSWFRIRPASPGSLHIEDAFVDAPGQARWDWTLALTVDSVSFGERAVLPQAGTKNTTSTVTNTGSNRGIVVDVPGEVATDLRVDVRPSAAVLGRRLLVSSFSVPWTSPLIRTVGGAYEPFVIRDDSGFNITGASSRDSGRSFLSGGSSIKAPMTTNAIIFTGNANNVTLPPGRYLVVARLYREGNSGAARLRLAQKYFSSYYWQDWRWWRPTDGGWRSSWMVLGELQHPFGANGEGLDERGILPPEIAVEMRGDGSGSTMHVDQVAYLPVSLANGGHARVMMAQYLPGVGPSQVATVRVDGLHRRTSVIDSAGKTHASPQPLTTGSRPSGWPGMATAVSVLMDSSSSPIDVDNVDWSTDLTISVQPRHVHLAGA